MNAFERLVADSLVPVLEGLDREHGEAYAPYIIAPRDLAEHLAPRVAAAIAAGWRYNPYARNMEGSLRALRGEA